MTHRHKKASSPGNHAGDIQNATISLAIELINRPSVTPEDAGCQRLIEKRLSAAGFACECMPFGEVSNLWAKFGNGPPLLCLAGHTDVVPPGDPADWQSDPFAADVRGGRLYGRGAADMKGGLAAMITAAERYVAAHPDFLGSLAFLVTSDEEGIAEDGTRKVIAALRSRGEKIDYCIVGEPSSDAQPGDNIRIGRRGSLTGSLQVAGIAGHVAYPELANNPIRQFAPALAELLSTVWDEGNALFPPTTFEVTQLESSSGANNVIPGSLVARFNLRYSTVWHYRDLQKKFEDILDGHDVDYNLQWIVSGEPFLTEPGKLTESASQAVRELMQFEPAFSTGGGTSDGRFISRAGTDVIELGLVNATIHKTNENVLLNHLPKISSIYQRIFELLFNTM